MALCGIKTYHNPKSHVET